MNQSTVQTANRRTIALQISLAEDFASPENRSLAKALPAALAAWDAGDVIIPAAKYFGAYSPIVEPTVTGMSSVSDKVTPETMETELLHISAKLAGYTVAANRELSCALANLSAAQDALAQFTNTHAVPADTDAVQSEAYTALLSGHKQAYSDASDVVFDWQSELSYLSDTIQRIAPLLSFASGYSSSLAEAKLRVQEAKLAKTRREGVRPARDY